MSTLECLMSLSPRAQEPVSNPHKLFTDYQPKIPLIDPAEDSDELIELGDTDDDDAYASDSGSVASLSLVYRMGPLQSTTTPIDLDQDDAICVEFSGDEATTDAETHPNDSHYDHLNTAEHDSDDDEAWEAVSENIIIQRFSRNDHVVFDKVIKTSSAELTCIVDSNGLDSGVCEWEIEIIHTDVDLQEIGVIGAHDIEALTIDDTGIRNTASCGHRSVLGNELSSSSMFLETYGDGDELLCYRDLSQVRRIGWCTGDVVKVCLDLDDWRITYFVNGTPMGKAVQLQRDRTYYPVICFAGQCQYALH